MERLKERWTLGSRLLFLTEDPDTLERNDAIADAYRAAFPMSGMSIREIDICDRRNMTAAEKLDRYDCLILSGGHGPTQNAFSGRSAWEKSWRASPELSSATARDP